MLEFCQKQITSASGRNDTEHQKTAMHTIATFAYDAVNPFERISPQSYRNAFHQEKAGETASTNHHG
jgi:hypothetical protein